MRCSLKDGFVILLIFFFTPFQGKGYPLFLHKNSIADRSINFNDFPAMSRVEESLDSFPKLGEYDKRSHKIVKKQMTASDYKQAQKNKRSVLSLQGISSREDGPQYGYTKKLAQAMSESASNRKKKKSALWALKNHRDLEHIFFKKNLLQGNSVLRRGIFSKKQKQKKVSESEQMEKEIESSLDKGKAIPQKTEAELERPNEKESEKQNKKENEKALENTIGSISEGENQNALKNTKPKVKENLKENPSEKKLNFQFKPTDLQDQYKILQKMVGCTMENYCRFPDIQDNHDFFECESDDSGCIKLTHKKCPEGEIFSSRFLECLKPFFWKLVEREKRSLWKKGKKQYSNTWGEGQSPVAWTDVTHEEGKQFLSELRPKYKPKLVVYHLKVKKAAKDQSQKEKKEHRRTLDMPRQRHSEINRKPMQKAFKPRTKNHQLFPRSFIIRINKKEGKSSNEESASEDESDDTDDIDDEEDDEEDYESNEETSDEEEYADDEGDDKIVEKGGIKEFLKSAKEAITNKARFNEPADTSFTLDKTNAYSKNQKLDGSEKDSRKILIDADIKVDKTLGKTLKRILGKRRDVDDDRVSLNGGLLNYRGGQDQMKSEQITLYENLIKSNPRLKRYFLVSHGEGEN